MCFFCVFHKRKPYTDLEKHEIGGQTEVKLFLDWIAHSRRLECMLLMPLTLY